MADNIGMATHLAGQSLRLGWFLALNRIVEQRSAGVAPAAKATRPVPTLRELLTDIGQLLLSDALAVRDGLYPPMEDDATSLPRHFGRVRDMLAELPRALDRRKSRNASTAKAEPSAGDLPDYYAQDFHFQNGGYLTEESARLYDVQVEILFMGAAAPMRRAALRPIAEFLRGRDQRHVSLVDVACGTGRFLRQVRLCYPALKLTGVDLSRPYLDEARRHLLGLRAVDLIEASAEKMPLADASADIVTSVFLFHELPPDVRRQVTSDIARILKPGGLFVFLDSLQMGDRPKWDGLLEAFPARFHEPYYRHYATEDLDRLFTDRGLTPCMTTTAFLSKLIVCRKT
ncbi:MAG: class I SAM-dependent methyltransferase [Hyphomicrobiaceae bacterium]